MEVLPAKPQKGLLKTFCSPRSIQGCWEEFMVSDAMEREKKRRKEAKEESGREGLCKSLSREECGRLKGQEFKAIFGYIMSWRVT